MKTTAGAIIGLHRVNTYVISVNICNKWLHEDVSNLWAMHTNNILLDPNRAFMLGVGSSSID